MTLLRSGELPMLERQIYDFLLSRLPTFFCREPFEINAVENTFSALLIFDLHQMRKVCGAVTQTFTAQIGVCSPAGI